MCIKVFCYLPQRYFGSLSRLQLDLFTVKNLGHSFRYFQDNLISYYETLGSRQMEFAAVLSLCYGQITEQTEFFLLFLTTSFLYCLILQIKNKKEIFL